MDGAAAGIGTPSVDTRVDLANGVRTMVILGVILLVIGLLASISVLTTIGAILIVVGLILNLVPIRGERRLYY